MNVTRIAIIGDGTTAVNAVHRLIEQYNASNLVLPPLDITIFGKAPEEDCGKGFAFGRVGGAIGNLTECPLAGRADYQPNVKGDFVVYARQLGARAPASLQSASRELVGEFHAHRYTTLKEEAGQAGIGLHYRQSEVNGIYPHKDGYIVEGSDESYRFQNGYLRQHRHSGFDRIVVAVGDGLSRRFAPQARRFPNQAFESPYHAADPILAASNEDTVTLFLGTRSSFVDAVIGYRARGYRGKMIGVSSTGLTSWPGDENNASYTLRYLTADAVFSSVKGVLSALCMELSDAKGNGVYVPSDLLRQLSRRSEERLSWVFDLQHEAQQALTGKQTYHDVVQNVPWEAIYEKLSLGEQKKFNTALADFALYNRVNRIVPKDYEQLVDAIKTGQAQIVTARFDDTKLQRTENGRIRIPLEGAADLTADFVVNCSIGPAPSASHVYNGLFGDLIGTGLIAPRDGSGFEVLSDHRIDLLGSAGRPYAFSGIGLESYGRQIASWAVKTIESIRLDAPVNETQLFNRRHAHG